EASVELETRLGPVSMADVLARCVQRCEGLLAGKRVSIRCEIDPDLPRVHGDFVKLQQAFAHLVGNAVKLVEEGDIVVHASHHDKQVLVTVSEPGGSTLTVAIPVVRATLQLAS